VEQLTLERQRQYVRRTATRTANDRPFREPLLDQHANVLNEKAAAFYHRHGVGEIPPAAESGLDLTGQIVLSSRYCLRFELGLCGNQLAEKGYREPLFLIDQQNRPLALQFDCQNCRMHLLLSR